MLSFLKQKNLAILSFLFTFRALAGEPVPHLSEEQFRALATRIAPKVNLFAEVWRQDPQAEFYGGTARDYLYWLKGQFKKAKTPEQTQAVIRKLETVPSISIDDVLVAESDVDVIGKTPISLNHRQFGARKVDNRGPEIFDPKHHLGKNELDQGYIPAEKIRISKAGILPPTHFGNGVREIYDGKLTVHFTSPDVFAQSHYAKLKLNHPILLAMRYLRLQAVDYFQNYGQGAPDETKLLGSLDPESSKKVREVIHHAMQNRELSAYMRNSKFVEWINGSIHKAFRSHTNPSAAMALMRSFEVPKLIEHHTGIETLDQYLFAKARDPKKITQNYQDYGVEPEKLFLKVSNEFSDGRIYHGTRDSRAFRNILTQGIHPSSTGSAGKGLYGVPVEKKAFAEEWGKDKNRLISLDVAPSAKIVDITHGLGENLWIQFQRRAPARENSLEDFAEFFGIDIIRYPYNSTKAYVVKNGAVLQNARGVYMQPLTLSMALDRIAEIDDMDSLQKYLDAVDSNPFSQTEAGYIAKELEKQGKLEFFFRSKSIDAIADRFSDFSRSGGLREALRTQSLLERFLTEFVERSDRFTHVALLNNIFSNLLAFRGTIPITEEKLKAALTRFEEKGLFKEFLNPPSSVEELDQKLSLVGKNTAFSRMINDRFGDLLAQSLIPQGNLQEYFGLMKKLITEDQYSQSFQSVYFSRLFTVASEKINSLDGLLELNEILDQASGKQDLPGTLNTRKKNPLVVAPEKLKAALAGFETRGIFKRILDPIQSPDDLRQRIALIGKDAPLWNEFQKSYGERFLAMLPPPGTVENHLDSMINLLGWQYTHLSHEFKAGYFSRYFDVIASDLKSLEEIEKLNRIVAWAKSLRPPFDVPDEKQKAAFVLFQEKGLFSDLSSPTSNPAEQTARLSLIGRSTTLNDLINAQYRKEIMTGLKASMSIQKNTDEILAKEFRSLDRQPKIDDVFQIYTRWFLSEPESTEASALFDRISKIYSNYNVAAKREMTEAFVASPSLRQLPQTAQAIFQFRDKLNLTTETLSPGDFMFNDPSARRQSWEHLMTELWPRFLGYGDVFKKAVASVDAETIDTFLSKSYHDWIVGNGHAGDTVPYRFFMEMAGHPDFPKHPNAARWAKDLIRAGLNYWNAVPKRPEYAQPNKLNPRSIANLLNTIVRHSPSEGSRYFEKILGEQTSPDLDEPLRKMLEQEPWKSHPLQSIWKSSLSYDVAHGGRKNYYALRKFLSPLTSARIRRWVTRHASNSQTCVDQVSNKLLDLAGSQ